MLKLKPKFKLHNFMFIYVITTIVITALSSSRYTKTFSSDTFTKVAVMANTVSTTMQTPISGYPGCDPIICPIVITNAEEDTVCEVSQEFVIELMRYTDVNIPLQFDLYKDELCTEVINKDENGMYVDEEFKFKAEEKETKTYYLKIEWPEDKNEEYLAYEIEAISINVIASQID